jgi:hypothetical protein
MNTAILKLAILTFAVLAVIGCKPIATSSISQTQVGHWDVNDPDFQGGVAVHDQGYTVLGTATDAASTFAEGTFRSTGKISPGSGVAGMFIEGGDIAYNIVKEVGNGSAVQGARFATQVATGAAASAYYGSGAIVAAGSNAIAAGSSAAATAGAVVGGVALAPVIVGAAGVASVGYQTIGNYTPLPLEAKLDRDANTEFPSLLGTGAAWEAQPKVGTISQDGTKVFSKPWIPWNNNYWAER